MTIKLGKLELALAGAAMLTVAGCGGGGDSAVSPPTAAKTSVPVTVIDGAIKNAMVCLDKNLNGICDSGEPSGKTDAAGNVTLQVPTEDAGKYPILAVVGTDAVDADHGPVTTPFTLQAPADKTAVVSPLTTLVQTLIASTGATSAQAKASVKAQTGLNVSLFTDFTKGSTADNQAASTLARMIVVITQQQSSLLASTVGTTAMDGAVIRQADLDKIIQNKLLEILPALLTALADPSVQAAASPAAMEAALLAQANALVANPSTGLTTASVATLVAINNQLASSLAAGADAPAASGILRSLNFEDTTNWSVRTFVSTLAQNTPDASGNTKFVSRRYNSVGGMVAAWNNGGSPNRQSDLHFNGSNWISCAVNSENTSTVRDANGKSSYDYCDKVETGRSNRAVFDIADRSMIDVYNEITAAGYANLSINLAASVLGSAKFPANAKLFYQSNTPLSTAVAYYPGSSNYVMQYSAALAAGGDTTSGGAAACNSSEFSLPPTYQATKLEDLINTIKGTPCVFVQNTLQGTSFVSDVPNEAWGQSTLGIGQLGSVKFNSTPTAYYTGNTNLRVAFTGTGANPVTYYACKERFTNGSTRNCAAIGTGSYTISTVGDARVMTLSNPPLLASGLGYQGVFVERGGKVYFGYQSNTTTTNTAELNLAATNALASQLGLPAVDPDTPLVLTRTSYTGDWEVSDPNANGSTIIHIYDDGNANCTSIGSSGTTNHACTVAFTDLAAGAFNLSDPDGTATGTLNFLTGAASGTYADTNPPATGNFIGARR